jgi:hypothetical protein
VLYRYRGRVRRFTLGPLKAIGLAEARTRARDRDRLRHLTAPTRPAEKQHARRVETIADLAPDYVERYAKKPEAELARGRSHPARRDPARVEASRRSPTSPGVTCGCSSKASQRAAHPSWRIGPRRS